MAETTAMRFIFSGKTDIGKTRKHNEDSFIISSDLKKNRWEFDDNPLIPSEFGALLVLADGAGGINAGGEAISESAVHAVAEKFRNLQRLPANDADARHLLQSVMQEAHQVIVEKAQLNSVYKNPSSTLIIAWLLDGKAHIAWSGDSRAYLVRNQNCELLTDDHSIVWQLVRQNRLTDEQARTHPDSHILTQCLGNTEYPPHPDALTARLKEGDRLLLSSDGVHSMMKHKDLTAILKYYETPAECCKALIDGANYAGGHDNSTVIIADVPIAQKPTKTTTQSSSSGIKNDIVKVKAPEEEIRVENPRDAVMAGALIVGFLIVFLFGFVFGNEITGVAEIPDEEPQDIELEINQPSEVQNLTYQDENLALLPEETPNTPVRIKPQEITQTAENDSIAVDSVRTESTINPEKTVKLQSLLKDILDKKDISKGRIDALKNKVSTADEKQILKGIEKDFGQLYPKLKTITNSKSELNPPKNSDEFQRTEKVLQETANILKKIVLNLQKLE